MFMLKRACKASGRHAMVRVLDGGMMLWCVNMHPSLISTLKSHKMQMVAYSDAWMKRIV